MADKPFTDQDMMAEALTSQKFITTTYNTFANECASPALKSEFVNILNEEHQIEHEIFTEMQKRGWYQTQPADEENVAQAKMKFSNPNR